jgi:hypothetical protein
MTHVAEHLGISRNTRYRKLRNTASPGRLSETAGAISRALAYPASMFCEVDYAHSYSRYLRHFHGLAGGAGQGLGHRVTGSDANVYPPMSTQLEAQGIE